MDRRMAVGAAAVLAACAACGGGKGGLSGLDLGLGHFGCDIEGVHFEGNRPGEYLPLAVGETQVFAAVVGLPSSSLCDIRGSFTRLQWISDQGAGETITEARLVACEACTVLYQGRREVGPGRYGVQGAAELHASRQRVHFEVTGVKPGLGGLTLLACFDEYCVKAAADDVYFRVAAAPP